MAAARVLVIFGLALLLAAVLVHLVAALLAIAIPLGIGLVLAGVIWHLVSDHPRSSS
jgi:hypothetical protein